MDIQAVYDRQFGRVYRIAMLYLKNSADAEDVAQTVFLRYLEKKISFRDPEHEKAWFITAARNRCRDILRSYWRKNVDFGEVPEQAGEERDAESALLPLILKLPLKYREVLYLYYYEEYAVREISRMLGRKESTVQTQLADARKKLKQMIEGKERADHVG